MPVLGDLKNFKFFFFEFERAGSGYGIFYIRLYVFFSEFWHCSGRFSLWGPVKSPRSQSSLAARRKIETGESK